MRGLLGAAQYGRVDGPSGSARRPARASAERDRQGAGPACITTDRYLTRSAVLLSGRCVSEGGISSHAPAWKS